MANNIALAQKYLPMLDEVYKANAKTSILDATKVDFVGGNTVKVFKIAMDGLGNYNRATGYAPGDVVGSWETMTLAIDRGRSFIVDEMDDEETARMAFGKLAGEFIRTKVVPEVDAYAFAKMAGTTGIDAATPADITVGTTDVAALIDEGERSMNENEVPAEGRLLFIAETAYAGLKSKILRTVNNGVTGLNNGIETYNNMQVIRVPQNRFYSAITMADGRTSGQTAGGYSGTKSSGYKLNFMIVHPSAVTKVLKHVRPRIFDPSELQSHDGWKFDYRVYHDLFVYENKAKGIYMHRGATAL